MGESLGRKNPGTTCIHRTSMTSTMTQRFNWSWVDNAPVRCTKLGASVEHGKCPDWKPLQKTSDEAKNCTDWRRKKDYLSNVIKIAGTIPTFNRSKVIESGVLGDLLEVEMHLRLLPSRSTTERLKPSLLNALPLWTCVPHADQVILFWSPRWRPLWVRQLRRRSNEWLRSGFVLWSYEGFCSRAISG